MCVVHYSQDAHLHSTYAPVPMYHAYAKYRAPPKRGKGSDILLRVTRLSSTLHILS